MRVGLTGGVGSGKSTVSRILAELGAVVIDADVLAREVVAAGTTGLAAVAAEFGDGVLTHDGELDRPAVAARVFGDPDARRRLEAIIHPLVHRRRQELADAAPPGAVVINDIPLLTETGRAGEYDAVIVVDVPESLQVERLVRDRGWTPDEARSRIAAQASREERLAIATHVIENSGGPDELRARVAAVYAALLPNAH